MSTDAAIPGFAPWPPPAPRRRSLARRRGRGGLSQAGIERWGATLFVVALCVIAWELPFFEASGEVGCGCAHHVVDIPFAENASDLELAPILVIDHGEARLDGRRLSTAGALTEALATMRRNWSVLHPREPFPGTIMVQAARDEAWSAIGPLLVTAAIAGYPHISFVVRSEGSGAAFDWARFAPRP